MKLTNKQLTSIFTNAENHQIFFTKCDIDDEKEIIYTDGEVVILKQVSVGTTSFKSHSTFDMILNNLCCHMSKKEVEDNCYYEILGLSYDEKTLIKKYLGELSCLKPDIYKLIPEYC